MIGMGIVTCPWASRSLLWTTRAPSIVLANKAPPAQYMGKTLTLGTKSTVRPGRHVSLAFPSSSVVPTDRVSPVATSTT